MRLRRRSRIPSIVGSRRKFPAHSRGTPLGGPHAHHQGVHNSLRRQAWNTWQALPSPRRTKRQHSRAFHSCPLEKGKSTVRLVLDNPSVAKSILDRQKTDYVETEVARVTLSHRPGELARAAATAP